MWRVIHQYMDTFNGPADFLEAPVSPVTKTAFDHAKSTKMVHICEFTADLIKNNRLKLDSSRNSKWKVTYHDSCNISRGMGLLEEPRFILRNVVREFYEMPENTIRERTFCCGSGSGLGSDENMEMRLRGGFPRANAVKYVKEEYGVNLLACICAIDKATLPPLLEYWVPGVEVGGVHELVGNALVVKGEQERTTNLRGEPLDSSISPSPLAGEGGGEGEKA
jgi:Fe-S oxidoreductase